MQRFFTGNEIIKAEEITLKDKQTVHHIKNVLRLKPGELISLFDQQGNEGIAKIKVMAQEITALIIEKKEMNKNASPIKLTVACAIPKQAKFDEIVDKLTQLGVSRIIPLVTERVIVKLNASKLESRHKRWEKIALSACEQSKANSFVQISDVINLKELITSCREYDLKLIAHLTGKRQTLKKILAQTKPKNILVLIGPEGDFSDGEVKKSLAAGFIPVTLGEMVLRVDTAAIAIASFIRLYAQD